MNLIFLEFIKINYNMYFLKFFLKVLVILLVNIGNIFVFYIKKIFYFGNVCDDTELLGGELVLILSIGEV